MRTIQRDIASGFIFSADNKILLGHNHKGGVYQGMLVVPGGGVDEGETKINAARREVMEETGIDTSDAVITQIGDFTEGESEKNLPSGERVLAKMRFYDFEIKLREVSSEVEMRFEDDYADAQWYNIEDLPNLPIGPAVKITLKNLHLI